MPIADHPDAAPTFSIVVPIYNMAQHLEECLESICGQSFADVEIIGVDDASTDNSPALLDAYTRRDARVRAEHLARNRGLGPARNAGLDLARGRYVLFVDSDDLLADGSLQAVAERLDRAGRPDLVLFGFARSFPSGPPVPDPRSSLLAPEAVLAARDRPELLEIFPSAWNKAYRREFLLGLGVRFPTGYYEDIPVTYPALMSAESIATLDRVCYLYRQRDAGNILRSPGRRHLELFAQWERAFAYLDAHPELEWWRPRLVDRISRHLGGVLDATDRIPPDLRREYFHATSAALRRYRPAGYQPDVGRGARLKLRLIESDRYPVFRTAQVAKGLVRRLRSR
jgi:glycosyltransferase involved in cell wall biosynthesis